MGQMNRRSSLPTDAAGPGLAHGPLHIPAPFYKNVQLKNTYFVPSASVCLMFLKVWLQNLFFEALNYILSPFLHLRRLLYLCLLWSLFFSCVCFFVSVFWLLSFCFFSLPNSPFFCVFLFPSLFHSLSNLEVLPLDF